ncbi:rod shape-determining protein MreC [Algoriphagus namhaensis]|uniref:Cell shape-determining protein MreC n=1 Tax=Algoriphagus namhaensis TaxID=915353 RepID=A0ABV8ALX7_9BACT
MLRIFQFLYNLRAFILFIILEVVAVWLIVSNNSPQGAAFFNSSSRLIGSVLETQSDVSDFLSLAEANEILVNENAQLLEELDLAYNQADSMYIPMDSTFEATFAVKGARVISNSLRFSQNHLTLNKGKKHGLKPGMGIFNQQGVVGRVKSVSENYAVGISLLNTDLLLSAKILSSDVFGSVQWGGGDSKKARLLYVPRHVQASAGDSVVTSGFNAIFPQGIPVGIISSVTPSTDNPNYLDIELDLLTDFSKVSYVYLIENTQLPELDSLYNQAEIPNEF